MATRLNVIFISGPRYSGKSTLIHQMADTLCRSDSPHYVRLVPVDDGSGPRLTMLGELKKADLSSRNRINYDASRIFEFLPECLKQIAAQNKSRTVLLEADADPNLRYAYPYDQRLFVMRAPRDIGEVFRSPNEAAVALRDVMDDTAAFASEMFGLFDQELEEEEFLTSRRGGDGGAVAEERVEVTAVQMRRFMNSPLGAEIASRIQLQPPYHSLMESDLILVNAALSQDPDVRERVVKQIQTMIDRLGGGRLNRPELFCCNPLNPADPLQRRLLGRLRAILNP